MTKRAGRASLVAILASLSVVGIVALLFLGGESPTVAAGKFMTAFAEADIDGLMETSYLEGRSDDELREKWKYTLTKAAPHYRFLWNIKDSRQTDPETAVVKLDFISNAMSGGAYPEPYELTLRKVNEHWKVSLSEINRKMFPGLPR